MKSFVTACLVVLTVLNTAVCCSSIVYAEELSAVLYVGWRNSNEMDNSLAAYNAVTGEALSSFTPIPFQNGFDFFTGQVYNDKLEGMAISPYDGLLYTVSGSSSTGGIIKAFDPLTGEYIKTVATLGQTMLGMTIDANGTFYVSRRNSGAITKVSRDGLTIDMSWGTCEQFAHDVEIHGNTLYAGHTSGVSSWSLGTGGPANMLVDTSDGLSTNGVAFDGAGVLYTGNSEDKATDPDTRSVRQWDSTYLQENSEVILGLAWSGNYISDVEHWNGYLYAANNKDIHRYDIAAGSWEVICPGNHSYTGNMGPLAILDLTAVPEPGTLWLLGAGLLCLVCYTWKKQR